ncbi:hypothetical protein MNV49_001221 [Pseudohyphozyma bogoriensis]|nr:hypothetical protein MNV49_001221 [Pseudohyphozyma bogoriensis]
MAEAAGPPLRSALPPPPHPPGQPEEVQLTAPLMGTPHFLLVSPTFLSYFDNPSSAKTGGIVSSFSAGATVGAFGCALIADRFGRIWGFFTGACVVILGCALQTGAVNIAMLIVGRTITGLGAGQLTAVLPVYLSEVAPPSIRGMLGGLQMVGIMGAIFIASAASYAFETYYTNNWMWRGPLFVQVIPCSILVCIVFFLPESPRWLVSKGREDQAMKVLTRLHSNQGMDFVRGEFQEIKDQVEAEKVEYKPGWAEIFKRPSWRKRIILVCLLQWTVQFSGINCIQYYTATIYENLGFSTHESLTLSLIYAGLGLVFTCCIIPFIDKFGRRPLLIGCTALMSAALLVQAVLSQHYNGQANPNPNALRAQVAMFYVFDIGFVATGALAWLIPAELLPLSIRGKGNSLSVAHNNIAGLVVAQFAPVALDAVGFKIFYLFVACDLASIVLYVLFYPETKKLTLEQIDVLFGDQLVPHVLAEPQAAKNESVREEHFKEDGSV